jgi:hypothetical protein
MIVVIPRYIWENLLNDSSLVDVILQKFVGNVIHCVDLSMAPSHSQYPANVFPKRSADVSVCSGTRLLVFNVYFCH